MYTPPAYAEHDARALHDFMRAHSFATLVTAGPQGVLATHLPFLLRTEGEQATLITHLARNNPHSQALLQGSEALVIFQGPHAFVSPSWYENRQTFPTWNYTAVHARGPAQAIEDPAAIREVLRQTVAHYDTPLGGPWDFESMPDSLTLPRLKAIIAVEIPLHRLEGKMKLNQDKSVADRLGVIAALERGGDCAGREVARLIKAQADMTTSV